MVEKYTTSKIYETIAFGGEASLPVEFVSATDYAALEAERDELKRRLDKIKPEADFVEYVYSEGLARKIRAILEGRDNG